MSKIEIIKTELAWLLACLFNVYRWLYVYIRQGLIPAYILLRALVELSSFYIRLLHFSAPIYECIPNTFNGCPCFTPSLPSKKE